MQFLYCADYHQVTARSTEVMVALKIHSRAKPYSSVIFGLDKIKTVSTN